MQSNEESIFARMDLDSDGESDDGEGSSPVMPSFMLNRAAEVPPLFSEVDSPLPTEVPLASTEHCNRDMEEGFLSSGQESLELSDISNAGRHGSDLDLLPTAVTEIWCQDEGIFQEDSMLSRDFSNVLGSGLLPTDDAGGLLLCPGERTGRCKQKCIIRAIQAWSWTSHEGLYPRKRNGREAHGA